MDKNLSQLITLITNLKLDDGINDTLIPQLKIIKTSKIEQPTPGVYKPCLCLILQGEKDVIVGDKIYHYAPGQYICSSVEVPVTGKITKASQGKPYLCLMIEIDSSTVFDVIKDNPNLGIESSKSMSGTFVNEADPRLYEAFSRMVKSLDTPGEINFLAPMIFREIVFRLLNDKNASIVRQMGIAGSHSQRITNAIGIIKKNFNHPVNVEELAHEVGMSPSSFHKHFKDITNMSPLQYQKLIRLQEARRMLLSESGDAASVGFEVGYESPSQFSREYARLFGKPPKQDARSLKS